jgi:hypothetical protein
LILPTQEQTNLIRQLNSHKHKITGHKYKTIMKLMNIENNVTSILLHVTDCLILHSVTKKEEPLNAIL